MTDNLIILRQGEPLVILRERQVPLIVEREVPFAISIERSGSNFNVFPSGGAAVWGGITGSLTEQSDLQASLDAKLNDNQIIDGGNF